jgi:hypothetical protein
MWVPKSVWILVGFRSGGKKHPEGTTMGSFSSPATFNAFTPRKLITTSWRMMIQSWNNLSAALRARLLQRCRGWNSSVTH